LRVAIAFRVLLQVLREWSSSKRPRQASCVRHGGTQKSRRPGRAAATFATVEPLVELLVGGAPGPSPSTAPADGRAHERPRSPHPIDSPTLAPQPRSGCARAPASCRSISPRLAHGIVAPLPSRLRLWRRTGSRHPSSVARFPTAPSRAAKLPRGLRRPKFVVHPSRSRCSRCRSERSRSADSGCSRWPDLRPFTIAPKIRQLARCNQRSAARIPAAALARSSSFSPAARIARTPSRTLGNWSSAFDEVKTGMPDREEAPRGRWRASPTKPAYSPTRNSFVAPGPGCPPTRKLHGDIFPIHPPRIFVPQRSFPRVVEIRMKRLSAPAPTRKKPALDEGRN